MKFFGKGQVDDRILHTKVTNVSLKQAQDMIANKVNERYGGGPEGPAQLKRAFQSFDSGRSGSISIPDFKTAMIQYTQLEFEDNIIAELLGPFENDGEIDYQEFVAKGTGQVRRTVPSVPGTYMRYQPVTDPVSCPRTDGRDGLRHRTQEARESQRETFISARGFCARAAGRDSSGACAGSDGSQDQGHIA